MYIVTHPGMAHRDEIVAISLLLSAYKGEIDRIDRRQPTDDEMEDPSVFVVDIGGRHEPYKGNFDHHQLPKSEECAMTLVAQYLGLHSQMEDTFGWYHLTALMDSQGPSAVAAEVGADASAVTRLRSSPVEVWMLGCFGRQSVINIDAGDGVSPGGILSMMGCYITDQLEELAMRLAYLEASVEVVQSCGLTGLFLARDPKVEASSFGLDVYRRKEVPEAAFSISPDNRGSGYAFFRYDPYLDFSRLAGDPCIEFAHTGGFIAKTREALSKEECLSLIPKVVTYE